MATFRSCFTCTSIPLLLLLLLPHLVVHTGLLLSKFILETQTPEYFVARTTSVLFNQTECPAQSLPFAEAQVTPNFLGTIEINGEATPGKKAELIISYIFKHINYDSVKVSWGASWLSLDFASITINDLSLNPALAARRLKVKLSLHTLKWLFKVSTFFKGGGDFGYGVFDIEAEGLKVILKTGGVEVRTYPMITVVGGGRESCTGARSFTYGVEPVQYPTNLHPFISNLPLFPTGPTFFKVGIVDAKDVEITIQNKMTVLHQRVYAIPEYFTNVTKVNRHGTDEWEGIDVVDFPLLIKKDIVAVLESAVSAMSDLEDIRTLINKGAEWIKLIIAEGAMRNVVENYGVGRRGRKKWAKRLLVARENLEVRRVEGLKWLKWEAVPWVKEQGVKADSWWKGKAVPWVAVQRDRTKGKAESWWNKEALPFLERERTVWKTRVQGWQRKGGGSGGGGDG
ncbi:hypothetical protein TrCOL_g1717 [Triparma columacea]|uniref:Uncharacterized protein n=1 Tax=Triparma columacea TaxID=722753 RepID=A0A9W7GAI7_9STRA|nr:hypothetical protein TrCOL_g1717 [Triparma columacea]